jgi:DNA-binding CsgD family transcriptional regulator
MYDGMDCRSIVTDEVDAGTDATHATNAIAVEVHDRPIGSLLDRHRSRLAPLPERLNAFHAESNGRPTGVRIYVTESAASQSQVAKWIVAEAKTRGFRAQLGEVDLVGAGSGIGVDESDVVLMVLGPVPSEWEATDTSVAWEQWSEVASSILRFGATLVLVAAGAPPAGLALCRKQGAHAIVSVDQVEPLLDLLQDYRRGNTHAVDLCSALPHPFADEQLDRLGGLTPIELRVLFYLVKGYPAGHIATVQKMSLSTVRAHIRSIFRKLQVNSQLAAVALANGTAAADLAVVEGSKEVPHCTIGMPVG